MSPLLQLSETSEIIPSNPIEELKFTAVALHSSCSCLVGDDFPPAMKNGSGERPLVSVHYRLSTGVGGEICFSSSTIEASSSSRKSEPACLQVLPGSLENFRLHNANSCRHRTWSAFRRSVESLCSLCLCTLHVMWNTSVLYKVNTKKPFGF